MVGKKNIFLTCAILSLIPIAEQKLTAFSLDSAGSVLMGGLTGGPAGAFAAANNSGSSASYDQSGQDFSQPPASQSYYQEMAPGDVPMMTDDQASLFASFANQPQTPYQEQYVDTSSDFGVLSAPSITPTTYTGYDPSTSTQYPSEQSGYDSSTIQSPFAPTASQGFSDPSISYGQGQTPVVVNNNIGGAPGQGDGSSSSDSSSGMNSTQISATAAGGAGVLGLSGLGGAALLKKRRQQQQQMQNIYDDSGMVGNTMPLGLPRVHRNKASTDYGDIYTERDKFGNEVPQIKTASALRRMTWSDEKKDEYQILYLTSKLELARNERQGYGIESLKTIEADRAQVERLRQQLALQRMQKQQAAARPSVPPAHQPLRQVSYQNQPPVRAAYQSPPRLMPYPQQSTYQTRQTQPQLQQRMQPAPRRAQPHPQMIRSR